MRLNRVLQAGVMQLGPADFELDMPRLKQQLSQTPGEMTDAGWPAHQPSSVASPVSATQ